MLWFQLKYRLISAICHYFLKLLRYMLYCYQLKCYITFEIKKKQFATVFTSLNTEYRNKENERYTRRVLK